MDIDRLDIVISAEASKAEKQLNILMSSLNKLSKILGGLNTSGLNRTATSVRGLSAAMQGLKGANTSSVADLAKSLTKFGNKGIQGAITNLPQLSAALQGFEIACNNLGNVAGNAQQISEVAKNLSKLGNKGILSATANLPQLSSSILEFSNAFNSVGDISQSAQQIGEVAKNVSKLGNKGMQNAIDNMPKLAAAMEELISSLSRIPSVSGEMVQMFNAVSGLAAQASKLKGLGSAVGSIGRQLSNTRSGSGTMSSAMSGTTKQSGKLSEAFSKLKASMSGFASSSIMVSDRTKDTGKAFVDVTGKIAKLVAAYRILEKTFGGFIEKSMDYVEVLNYFNVAFESVGKTAAANWKEAGYDSAESYVNSFAERAKQLTSKMTGFAIEDNGTLTPNGKKSLGMDPEELMNYQAGFAQMSNSIGVTSEMSLKLSNALTMLGADLASVKNISFASAWNNLQSGMAGMSRAVDKFGINIRNVNLEQKAAELGYYKSASAMNQNEKEMLRVIIMLESTKYAWGDMAETLNAPANQLRLLQQNFANLARMIGNIFLPVVAKVLPYINGLVIALQRLFSWIGSLLGLDFSGLGNIGGGSSGLSDLLDDAETANGAIGDISTNADDVGDALDNADKAAKKLKRTILGFDELNVLDNNDTSSSTGSSVPSGGGAGGIGNLGNYDMGILEDALSKAIEDYQKAWDEAFSHMENKANNFADTVEAAFKRIWNTAEPTRKAIADLWYGGFQLLGKFSFDTLKDFWNNFLKPVGTWMIGNDAGLPRLFNITNALLTEIDWGSLRSSLAEFYSALQPLTQITWTALMDFYESFLKPIAVWTMSDAIPQLAGIMTDFINKINWGEIAFLLNNFWEALAPFAQNVGQGLINFYEDLMKIGADFINKVVPSGLSGLADAFRKISPEQAQAIGEAIGKFAIALLAFKGIASVVSGIASVGNAFSNLASGLGAIFGKKGIFATIGTTVGKLFAEGGIFGSGGLIVKALEGIQLAIFSLTGGAVVAPLGAIVAGIVAVGAALVDLWKTSESFRKTVIKAFNKVKDSLVKAFGKIKDTVEPLWESIKGFGDALYDFYESSGIKKIVNLFVSLTASIVGSGLSTAIDAISTAFAGLAKTLSGAFDIISGVFDIISGLLTIDTDKILKGFKELGNGIVKVFSGLYDAMFGVAGDIIDGLCEGILDAIADIGSWIKENLVDPFVDKVKEFFGINSPSTVFAEIGRYLIEGLLKGITDNIDSVLEWFRNLPDKIKTAAGNAKDWLREKGKGAVEGIKNGYDAVKESWLFAKFKGLKEETFSAVGDIADKVKSKGSDIILGIKEGYENSKQNGLLSKIEILRNDIFSSIGNISEKVRSKGVDIVSGITSGYENNKGKIQSAVSNISNLISSGIGNLWDVGRDAISSFANGFSSVHIPMPHIGWDWNNFSIGNFSFSVPSFNLQWYAAGGFPNAGELFMANEKGPEMIGKMGHRNVVANNKQITDGIKAAVVEGMMEVAMATSSGQSDDKPYVLNVTVKTEDNEVLARAVEKGRLKQDWRYNPSPAY